MSGQFLVSFISAYAPQLFVIVITLILFNCSYYKHNAVYSKDWSLFKDLDCRWIARFCHKVINFSEYFKFTKEKLRAKLNEKQSFRNVAESLLSYLSNYEIIIQSNSSDNCMHCYNIEILNIFYPEIQMINTKCMMKTKLIKLLSELNSFKNKTILVLEYAKRSYDKIFHSSAKLIPIDSDIDKAFKSKHQSIMTRIKNYASEDWNC